MRPDASSLDCGGCRYNTPEDENPVLTHRKDINKAITAMDFTKADKVQGDLLMLGDRRYAPRGEGGRGLSAPLLTPGR